MASNLADFYAVSNSWQGVDKILLAEFSDSSHNPGGMNMMGKGRKDNTDTDQPFIMGGMLDDSGQQILLMDEDANVLFDSWNELTGTQESISVWQSGTPIIVDEKQVGSFLVMSNTPEIGTERRISESVTIP